MFPVFLGHVSMSIAAASTADKIESGGLVLAPKNKQIQVLERWGALAGSALADLGCGQYVTWIIVDRWCEKRLFFTWFVLSSNVPHCTILYPYTTPVRFLTAVSSCVLQSKYLLKAGRWTSAVESIAPPTRAPKSACLFPTLRGPRWAQFGAQFEVSQVSPYRPYHPRRCSLTPLKPSMMVERWWFR